VTESTITYNVAGYDAGGVSILGDSSVYFSASTISYNTANDDAGGVDVYSSSVVFEDMDISDNEADDDGGGIRIEEYSSLFMVDSIVCGNDANDGGGIYHYSYSSGVIKRSTIKYNDAYNDGGGIFAFNDCSLDVENSVLKHNTAGYGGGMYVERDMSLFMGWCTFYDNDANYGGAGYFYANEGGRVVASFMDCVLTHNSAYRDYEGGAFYIDGPEYTGVDPADGISIAMYGYSFSNNAPDDIHINDPVYASVHLYGKCHGHTSSSQLACDNCDCSYPASNEYGLDDICGECPYGYSSDHNDGYDDDHSDSGAGSCCYYSRTGCNPCTKLAPHGSWCAASRANCEARCGDPHKGGSTWCT